MSPDCRQNPCWRLKIKCSIAMRNLYDCKYVFLKNYIILYRSFYSRLSKQGSMSYKVMFIYLYFSLNSRIEVGNYSRLSIFIPFLSLKHVACLCLYIITQQIQKSMNKFMLKWNVRRKNCHKIHNKIYKSTITRDEVDVNT